MDRRRILLWTGRALAATGVMLVIIQLAEYGKEIDLSRLTITSLGVIFMLAVTYGLINIILAVSWKRLLEHLGSDVSTVDAIRIYGLSQIGKYLPGNIGHLAGRQALGMSHDISAWVLAKSSVWELGLLVLSGCALSLLILPIVVEQVSSLSSFALVLLCVSAILGSMGWLTGRKVVEALIGYLVFLTVAGLLFYGLALILGSADPSTIVFWVGGYIVAWLLGLITPGAPAGVGTRELVLLFVLKGLAHEKDILLLVLVSRGVTVVGDLVFFMIALLRRGSTS